jgi:hypothetical protein
MKIHTHALPSLNETRFSNFKKRFDTAISRLTDGQSKLDDYHHDTILFIPMCCAYDMDVDLIQYCTIGADCMAAVYGTAIDKGQTFTIRINETPVKIPFSDYERSLNAHSWKEAFFYSVIARRKHNLDVLSNFHVTQLRTSFAREMEYSYFYVEFLQSIIKKERSAGEKLIKTLEATDPDRLEFGEDYALQIAVPELELFTRLLSRDEARFNKALAKALELHREYWSIDQEGENRSSDPKGFIALGPLAISCLAIMSGMTITVQSNYLPEKLLYWERE